MIIHQNGHPDRFDILSDDVSWIQDWCLTRLATDADFAPAPPDQPGRPDLGQLVRDARGALAGRVPDGALLILVKDRG